MKPTPEQIEAFWSKVVKTDPEACWAWAASHNDHGYPQVWMDGKMRKGARVVFFLTHERFPNTARHTCDNPGCLNPKHIVDGTQMQNIADREARGRGSKGAHRPGAKLDATKAASIRERYARGESPTALAREFAVSDTTIILVGQGKKWKSAA